MYLDSAKKKEFYTLSLHDALPIYLKVNHKDYATERSLKMLVGKRRRLLDYLIKTDIERYRAIIKELGIRK